jgi:two-component system, NarL family, sensor histidine kinase DesK
MLTFISPKRIGWEPYIHLVWLVFLLFPFFFDPTIRLENVLYLLPFLLLFFPVYFWTWTHSGPQQLWGIAALTLLGLLFTPLNYGASGLCIYAAAATGFAVRPKVAFRIVLGILGVVVLSALISSIPFPFVFYAFTPMFLMTAIIGGINIYQAEKERSDTKLHLAQDEIERLAKIAERERIARDLHDLLGHTLSIITLKAELASKLIDRDPRKAKEEINDVERISREATHQVREAVQGFKLRGLQGELAGMKLALESANIKLDYYIEPLQLSPNQESVLALALRESVTNIIRHSKASHCSIRVSNKNQITCLSVEDNGQGDILKEGSGLSGMRQRVETLGGRLEYKTENGCHLIIYLPSQPSNSLPNPQPLAPSPSSLL